MLAIKGFSRLSKKEKIEMVSQFTSNPKAFIQEIHSFDHPDKSIQEKLDSFSENTLTNFTLPYGVVPNLVINGKMYNVPVVIEESSVVAAAASAAGFWQSRGGFKARVLNSIKSGQVHFTWKEDRYRLFGHFEAIKEQVKNGLEPLTKNMTSRGGGLKTVELIDYSDVLDDYYQLSLKFDTVDSMGANFINSCLEEAANQLKSYAIQKMGVSAESIEIIMSILSNYTPECVVRVELSCPYGDLENVDENLSGKDFAMKFEKAVRIAELDVFRAVTHNKGILNGIDAVILSTGNDFRAVEAAAHAYAAKDGKYQSLSHVRLTEEEFHFYMEIPLAAGSVGGLTSLHPLAKWSFDILGNPNAGELMMIVACVGLANNFAAVKSLITKGIQTGHMKMHLTNMLNTLEANETEKKEAINYFTNKTVSFSRLNEFIDNLRKNNSEGK